MDKFERENFPCTIIDVIYSLVPCGSVFLCLSVLFTVWRGSSHPNVTPKNQKSKTLCVDLPEV